MSWERQEQSVECTIGNYPLRLGPYSPVCLSVVSRPYTRPNVSKRSPRPRWPLRFPGQGSIPVRGGKLPICRSRHVSFEVYTVVS